MARIVVIFIALLIWLAASAPAPASSSPITRERQADSRSGIPSDSMPVDADDDEVSPAVATYTIDHSGTLVEVHSPRTEVPRLKPPTT